VDIVGRNLGQKREGAAQSKNQKHNEGDASRKLFAGQHRPYPIRSVEGGDRSPNGGRNSSSEPDSSTIPNRCFTFSQETRNPAGGRKQRLDEHVFPFFCKLHRPRGPHRTVPATILRSLFMAIIAPFRAWRYNPERVPVQRAVTQPYDKITPPCRRPTTVQPLQPGKDHSRQRLPDDTEAENVYTRRRRPSRTGGRRPFCGRIRSHPSTAIPDLQASRKSDASRAPWFHRPRPDRELFRDVIFRHEQTLAKPKADRMDLLRATRAHFGQIFMLYAGAVRSMPCSIRPPPLTYLRTSLLKSRSPTSTASCHRVWRIADRAAISAFRQPCATRKLIIADGHHRYETALAYRNERQASAKRAGLPVPYDSVMMTFAI